MTSDQGKTSKSFLSENHFPAIILLVIILMGGFIRMIHVINLDFPLNDGGPFYMMMLDLQMAEYSIPTFTSYNLNNIPFAYPPFGFYTGALMSDFFNWPLLDVVRVLPSVVSIFTIPAFYSLSKKVFKDQNKQLAATAAFTFLPTSFNWLIVGGGLTRSFGYLFAILTLGQIYSLINQNKTRNILLAILFASLTILSHPGTTYFTFYCSLVILLFHYKQIRTWFWKVCLTGISALLLTAPWWFTVIRHHSYHVFTYPFQTEGFSLTSVFIPFSFLFTNEPMMDILAVCCLIGVFVCLKDGKYFLPAWFLSIFLFESRLGAVYSVVPVSLLIGVGVVNGITPIFTQATRKDGKNKNSWISPATLGFITLYIIINAYLGINYQTVTKEQISAMQWIAQNTPEESQFLVISGIPEYGIDPVSEWFPAISKRTSLTTPQAHEWLPEEEFSRRVELHAGLQKCANQDFACIETWSKINQIEYTHLYIPDLEFSLIQNENFDDFIILFEDLGGLVLERQ